MGLEPTTPCVTGRCSNQLSYNPKAGKEGFEPPTNALEVRGSIQLSYLPSLLYCKRFIISRQPLNCFCYISHGDMEIRRLSRLHDTWPMGINHRPAPDLCPTTEPQVDFHNANPSHGPHYSSPLSLSLSSWACISFSISSILAARLAQVSPPCFLPRCSLMQRP